MMNSAATALRRQLDDDFCGRLPASGGRPGCLAFGAHGFRFRHV